MLCNHKRPDQINSELSDLIGPDFDPGFTTWLFQTVAEQYPRSKQAEGFLGPAAASAAPEPAASTAPDSPVDFVYQPGPSARNGRGGRPNPFGPNANVYNTAISGVKRPRDDVNNRDDRSQRARTDGPPVNAPTGPRNPQPTDGMPAMAPPRRNLADRVGPPPGAIPVMSPMGPAFLNPQTGQYMPADMGQQQSQRGNRRNGRDQQQQQSQQQAMMFAPGSVPIFIPPGMMPQFPQGGMFPPQVFAQMQAQQAGAGGAFPAFGAPMMQPQQPQAPPQAVPTKPSDDGLCKYGTECKNAYCKFAHPSPAATKESGLVLSAEACENQLECKDPVRGVLFVDGTELIRAAGLLQEPHFATGPRSGQLQGGRTQ
jgi:hypothetical protein